MNKDSIALSPKYGVNPSVQQCYVCGEDVGVILFGHMKDKGASRKRCAEPREAQSDIEAPRTVCLDKEPCDKCKEHMKQGIILIGVRDGESGENPYRTGEFLVIKQEAAERLFCGEGGKKALEMRMAFVEQKVLKATGLLELMEKK